MRLEGVSQEEKEERGTSARRVEAEKIETEEQIGEEKNLMTLTINLK